MRTKIDIIQEVLGDDNPDTFEVMMSSSLIRKAMSMYAQEAVQEFIDIYEENIDVHDKIMEMFKKRL